MLVSKLNANNNGIWDHKEKKNCLLMNPTQQHKVYVNVRKVSKESQNHP